MIQKKSKSQRRIWWDSLTPEEQAVRMKRWETHREKFEPSTFDAPRPLTAKQRRNINTRMREIGLEKYIVLKD